MSDDRWVLGLDPAGRTMACTICGSKDANNYAKYYRGLKEHNMKRFHSVRIFTYDEMIEHDKKVDEKFYKIERTETYERTYV